MHNIQNIIIGLLVLGIVVFVHEFGHYLAARWRHIKVDVFSIGFGPVLTSWHDRAGTRWQLSLLPLGGYVKLYGFEGAAPKDEDKRDDEAFYNKPVLSRMLVTVMGPVFNFIFTLILFTGLFFWSGHPEVRPDIYQMVPGGAAQKAGLQVGDHVTHLNKHAVLGAADLQAQLMSRPGQQVSIGLSRHGQELTVPVTLDKMMVEGKDIGRLGIVFQTVSGQAMPIYKAVPMAFEQTWHLCTQIIQSIWQIISGQRSAKQLSGTVGIIYTTGQVAHYGIGSLVSFVAAISTSLGLFNLFPIPMLDGGHLIFYVAEAIRGRPVPERVQAYAFQVGLILVLLLFLFTFYNDLGNLGLFHWLVSHV